LGYTFNETPMDAVYNLTFIVPHTAPDLVVRFRGINLGGTSDEAWGLDNVVATVSLQEEPPDLLPAAVAGPASVGWGEVITVTWEVHNQGINPARGDWSDRIYLSADADLDDADTLLAGYDAAARSPLAAGAFYAASTYGTVPIGLAGDAFVLVAADGNERQVETDETNNLAAGAVHIRAPDLRLAVVTGPDTAPTGSAVTVSWRVENVGDAGTTAAAWSDRVLLSTDDLLGDDLILGTFPRTGALAAGGSYTGVQNVTLPVDLSAGAYRLLVVTDVLDQAPELPGGVGNVGISGPMEVTLAPVPDLVVHSVTHPAEGSPGGSLEVTWQVRNAGQAPVTGMWTDRLYLSPDGTVGNGVLLGSYLQAGPLEPGADGLSRSETVALPEWDDGTYILMVVTDATFAVYERDGESGNTVPSPQAVVLRHPNLTATILSAPASAESGEPVTVRWRITNAANGSAQGGWTDRLTITPAGKAEVILAESARTADLAGGASYEAEVTVALPDGIAGSFVLRLLCDAENEVDERADEGDNLDTAFVAMTLAPYPDFELVEVTSPSIAIGDPVDLHITWRVRNAGDAAGRIASWMDRVWLSTDESLGGGDTLLGEVTHDGLVPPGIEYQGSLIATMPAGFVGRRTVIVEANAERRAYEHPDTAANVGTPGHPTDIMLIPYADLVVNTVTADAAGQNGEPIQVTWAIANQGIGPTDLSSWSDVLYLVPEGGGSRRRIGGFSHVGALGVGEAYQRTVTATIPADTAGGNYTIQVETGGPFEFLFSDNNSADSGPVAITYVPPPQFDLEVTLVDGPPGTAPVLDGDWVNISWTVVNHGPDTVEGPWYDSVLVALNGDVGNLVELGRFSRGQPLEAGHSYSRTELVRMPVRAQGLYRVFVRSDSAAEEAETDEGNNLLGDDVTFLLALRPRPDLQVTGLLAPDQVPAGTVIDVEWVVTNLGTADTPTGGSRWCDGVYLSFDHRQDGGDWLLGRADNGSALAAAHDPQPAESYRTTGTYQLPPEAGGNLFVLVKADVDNGVDEYPGEDNNVTAYPIAIDVQPVPPPDLVTSHVAGPSDVFEGGAISVRYRVTNNGAGITYPASWSDTVWLTLGRDRPNSARGDIQLGSFGRSGALEVGQFYERTVQVTVPSNCHIHGQYYVTVWADAADAVYEASFDVNVNPDAPNDLHGSNFKAGNLINVLYRPAPDLRVTAFSAPAEARAGESVTVSWTVTNKGPIPTDVGTWGDGIWLSEDEATQPGGSGSWLVFGMPHNGILGPDESYSQTVTFTLPPSARGSYLTVRTNQPIASVTATDPNSPETALEQLHQEVEGVLGRAAEILGKPLEEATHADISQLSYGDIMYILVDNSSPVPTVWEGPNTDNNTRTVACEVTGDAADLAVIGVDVSTTEVFGGESVEVSYTVANGGAAGVWPRTRSWTERVYLTPEAAYDASRATLVAVIEHDNVAGLEPGESYQGHASARMPEGMDGRRYVHVFTNLGFTKDHVPRYVGLEPGQFPNWATNFERWVWEGGTGQAKLNNTAVSEGVDIHYRESDLKVVDIEVGLPGKAPSVSLPAGGEVTVRWTVRNEGERETRGSYWIDRVYISQDGSLDLYDEMLGSKAHSGGAVAPGAGYTAEITARIPDNIEGTFHILVYVDSAYGRMPAILGTPMPYPIAEGVPRLRGSGSGLLNEYRGEGNDITAEEIQVEFVDLPNLVVTQVTPSATVQVGEGFTVSYTVSNAGAGPVPDRQGSWADVVYLSRDANLDARGDHYIARIPHNGVLPPGQSYSVTRAFALPHGLPVDEDGEGWYVLVLTDVVSAVRPWGEVNEGSAEGDNLGRSPDPMLVTLPPPADLALIAVAPPVAPPKAGGLVSVSWQVSNLSAEVTVRGYWSDSVYLSDDAVWDLGDALLGRFDRGGPDDTRTLAPGEDYEGSLEAPVPPVLPGLKYIIVRCDIYDDIRETTNANNAMASGSTFEVAVPILVLGQPEEAFLSPGTPLLYRLDVPADLTVDISLDCADDGAANELYARYEGLPSSLAWDARYRGHLWADQTIRIPETNEGSYYILARSVSGAAAMPVTLLAREVPFSITDITPDRGGADRTVYLTVEGAQFRPSAILKLVRPRIGEYEPQVYAVRDATRIVAAFDLRGAPRGLYDVVVINPDGAEARVPYRFLVEAPLPLDVTVGMGGRDVLDIGAVGWYGVGLYSLTNIGTPYIHLEFGVPNVPNPAPFLIPGEALEFRTNFTGAPALDGVPWADIDPVLNLAGEYTARGFNADLVNDGYAGLSFSVRTYPRLDEILLENPRFLKDLPPEFKELLSFDFHIYAAATPMTVDEYIQHQRALAAQTREAILADSGAPELFVEAAAQAVAWEAGWLAALTDTGLLRPEHEPPRLREMPEFAGLVNTAGAAMLAMPQGSLYRSQTSDLGAFFERVRAWYGHLADVHRGSDPPTLEDVDMGLTHPTHFEAFMVRVGLPKNVSAEDAAPVTYTDYFGLTGELGDSVDLAGPNGAGEADFVPAGTPLPYVLSIQNPLDAEEAVHTLRAYIEVPEGYDILTFRLGDMMFEGVQVNIPDNYPAFTGEFDFVDERGYILRITGGPDTVSDMLLWVVTAIDPFTGLAVTDPGIGLLQPGATAVLGFTIKAHDEAGTGTELSLQARVLLDARTPVDSLPTFHTLDAEPPVSAWTVQDLGNGDYRVDWLGEDADDGSGVRDYTLYGAAEGGGYRVLAHRTTDLTFSYDGAPGEVMSFVVLAVDNAGNVEPLPPGVVAPLNFPTAFLGSLPEAAGTAAEALPSLAPPTVPATNPLFLEVADQVPMNLGALRRPAFATVYEPFFGTAFAWDFEPSGGGISPLGIAFHPDGTRIYVSGGRGRNELHVFGRAGGAATTPLAVLEEPLYDMLFDADGMLWASTGGGPLLQLDPETGAVLGSYGSRITLGLAPRPGSSQLYVATGDGVALFDTRTGTFTPFSSTRVDGLATAPDGTLWACAWPDGGQVLRFDSHGNPEIALELEYEAEALSFGLAGTALENLLFISHSSGGVLTLVDWTSLEQVPLALGGTRGDFLHAGPDGRLYATQSTQVDVFQPVVPPQVLAATPVSGALVAPGLHMASVVFSMDMDEATVLDVSHYHLVGSSAARGPVALPVTAVLYDPGTRTAHLLFAPLPIDRYTLTVDGLVSALGTPMAAAFTTEFAVLDDLSTAAPVTLSRTRLQRAAGCLAFDVAATNAGDAPVTDLRVVFSGLGGDAITVLDADGRTAEGYPYVDLGTADGTALQPGEQTPRRTLTVHNPDALPLEPQPAVYGYPDPNGWPEFTSTPPTTADIGIPYLYHAEATDPDAGDGKATLSFLLVSGPAEAVLDPGSGILDWTPQAGTPAAVAFRLRVYDDKGAYDDQAWTVAVGGGNRPPLVAALADVSVAEGALVTVPVAAADPDGDALSYSAANLPPGAVFDTVTGLLSWQTGAGSAGRYENITVTASDGRLARSQSFTIVVGNVNQPPVLTPVAAMTLAEGQTLAFRLEAEDPDGDTIHFGAVNLPPGATIDGDMGRCRWTPGFDQHGTWPVVFTASDGDLTARLTVTLTVENRNGPLELRSADRFVLSEGQYLLFTLDVHDPDHPRAAPPIVLPDGTMDTQGDPGVLSWTVAGLPEGAVFEPGSRALSWTPRYDQAGTYTVPVHVADDGDGTGVISELAFDLVLEVRDANGAPVLAPIPNRSLDAGATADIMVAATDPDGTV
ncbi:MAG: putative Ig domain-containing protein, partial [Lentisphaeria bacterium]|nr:putative Ig domain-containing protein [Lentisphaeria bacterium]